MQKRFTLLLVSIVIFSAPLFAQSFIATAGETILSYGRVDTDSTDLNAVIRFSPVFNFQEQFHYDFSKKVGFYTGLGIRNVGLISKVKYGITDGNGNIFNKEVTIKERSYSFGLPLALKFGDLDEGVNFAVGGEAEIMFAYKRKIIDGDTKRKFSAWFNDNVNIFNPSVFAEVKFKDGEYIRFKYYLLDFLNYQGISLIDQTFIADYGPNSLLFYISIGTVKLKKKVVDEPTTDPATTSAFFKSTRKHHHDPVAAGL